MAEITFKIKNRARKEEFITMPLANLEKYRADQDLKGDGEDSFVHMHEQMSARIRPVFDFDYKCVDEAQADNKELQRLIFNEALGQVQEQFPRAKYPRAIIVALIAVRKPGSAAKISAHFIVRQVKKMTPAQVKEIAQRFTAFKDSWDTGLYAEKRTLRMPYMTKEGEDRFLVRAEITPTAIRLFENEIKAYEHFREDYTSWLMSGEEEGDHEVPAPKKREDNVRPADDEPAEYVDTEDEFKTKGWTVSKARAIINRLAFDRADTHTKRLDGLIAIGHLARGVKKTKAFEELAHLFAMKDPNYDKDQTEKDWKYALKIKQDESKKPITFASLIYQANIDNPLPKVEEVRAQNAKEAGIAYYDKKRELLANNPSRNGVEKWMVGSLRYFPGKEEWYARLSTGGWSLIRNKKDNFPFGSQSSNTKFDEESFFEILQDIKDVPAYAEIMEIGEPVWKPLNDGEVQDPDQINTWQGLQWDKDHELTKFDAVKAFEDCVQNLFPIGSKYILDSLAYKLRNPRAKMKLVIGYGRFGGEGKNTLEAIIQRIFGKGFCLSTSDAGHILGKGDQGFNGGIENKGLCFLQEAKSEGKSITDDEKMKNFLSESTFPIRALHQNPRLDAPNYVWVWLWTNNPSAVKMTAAMLRRTYAEKVSSEKMDDKEWFDRLWAIERSDEQIQEIFTWLWNRDLAGFNVDAMPDTPFKSTMAEDSLTTTQRYIVDVCNNRRHNLTPLAGTGITRIGKAELYEDYKHWGGDEGLQPRYLAQLKNFTAEVANMDIVLNAQARYSSACGEKQRGPCFDFDLNVIEVVMRKFLRNKEWVLIQPIEQE